MEQNKNVELWMAYFGKTLNICLGKSNAEEKCALIVTKKLNNDSGRWVIVRTINTHEHLALTTQR